jgi:hypothetical protein
MLRRMYLLIRAHKINQSGPIVFKETNSADLIWPNGPFKYYASGIHIQLNTNVLVDFKNLNTPHL